MGLTYYKGEPYGDGSISPGEILTFYAVEGEAPSSGYINKVDTGEVDEHGNPIFRIEIPMGTTIENAFATDTVETHIVEDSERVRLQANVGTRLKWGNRPREGIIAGGIRVLLSNSTLCQWGTGSTSSNINYAKQKIDNYIYSDIVFPRETVFNNQYDGHSSWSCDASYWTEQGLDWKEYQERFSLGYYLNSYNNATLRYPNQDLHYYLLTDPSKLIIQDKIMTVPNTGSDSVSFASISSGNNFNPTAFGIIFVLDSLLSLSNESNPPTNADTSKTYAKVKGKAISFKSNTDASSDIYAYQTGYQSNVVQRNTAARSFWIPMSEDEVRYAMGISDVFDQMSYEEYVRHLPQEV